MTPQERSDAVALLRRLATRRIDCPHCSGRGSRFVGYPHYDAETCHVCSGSGFADALLTAAATELEDVAQRKRQNAEQALAVDELRRRWLRCVERSDRQLAALEAWNVYMGDQFSEGPDSSALHPRAARLWRQVREALASETLNGPAGGALVGQTAPTESTGTSSPADLVALVQHVQRTHADLQVAREDQRQRVIDDAARSHHEAMRELLAWTERAK